MLLLPVLADGAPSSPRRYDFEGTITQNVLENYLSRCLELPGICSTSPEPTSQTFDEDLRLIQNTGAKFITRAAYAWDVPADEEAHFAMAAERAKRLHDADPELLLQACIFETAYSSRSPESKGIKVGVEDIPVPAWVFEEFGLPVENRNFNYEAMLFPGGRFRNHWRPGASAPDIRQLETQMWYYYRARRYIDAGFESINMGQAMFTGTGDPTNHVWKGLLARIRKYGKEHARRKYVLLDAHITPVHPNVNVLADGEILWDFYTYPLRPVESHRSLDCHFEIGHEDGIQGRVPGGRHPAGWICDVLPHSLEFDNSDGVFILNMPCYAWGLDESIWFANLKNDKRDAFLSYAWDWHWNHDKGGYLIMPGRRPARTPINKPDQLTYSAHNPGPAYPEGFGQEDMIKAIWADPRYQDNSSRHITPPPQREGKRPQGRPVTRALMGRWTFESISREGIRYFFDDVAREGAGIQAEIPHARTPGELKALLLSEGDRNTPEMEAEGRKFLDAQPGSFSVKQVPGRHGQAVQFLKGGEMLDLGNDPRLAGKAFGAIFWIRVDEDRDIRIFEKGEPSKSGWALGISGGKLVAEIPPAAPVQIPAPKTGEWTRILLTWGDGKLFLYQNGKLVGSGTGVRGPVRSDSPLLVGRGGGFTLDDLAIFTRTLDPEDAERLAHPEKTGGLLDWLRSLLPAGTGHR